MSITIIRAGQSRHVTNTDSITIREANADSVEIFNWYISPTGSDTAPGDGTLAHPYLTLAKAVSVASAGQKIGCLDGIYHERGTTINKALTVKGVSGGTPIFSGSIAITSWYKTVGQTNVYEAAYTYAQCYGAWNGDTYLTSVASIATCDTTPNSRYFDNAGDKLYINIGGSTPTSIEVVDINAYAVIVTATGVTINTITFKWQMMPVDVRAGNSTITGCTFKNHAGWDKTAGAFAWIQLDGATHTVSNCTITGKYSRTSHIFVKATASAVTISGCIFADAYVGVSANGSTTTVDNCTFSNCSNSGVWVYAGTTTVSNCTATDNGHDGFGCTAGATLNAVRCTVNYTYDVPAPETGSLYGFVFHGGGTAYHCVAANLKRTTRGSRTAYNVPTTSPITIKNCIAYNCLVGVGDSGGGPPSPFTEDYNCINSCDTAYKKGYTPGAHDISGDPMFTNTTAGSDDFTLQAGSPCIDAGLYIPGINDGYLGAAPDIGRFEKA